MEALQAVSARLLGCVINMAPTRGPDAYRYDYSYVQSDRSKPTGEQPDLTTPAEAKAPEATPTTAGDAAPATDEAPAEAAPSDTAPDREHANGEVDHSRENGHAKRLLGSEPSATASTWEGSASAEGQPGAYVDDPARL